MNSNTVQFVFNNKLIELINPDPNQTLLNFIRNELKKTGTKEGCAEGGCGACTIVLGELKNNKIIYKSINACIAFTPTLHGKQLIVVEDLVSKKGILHPVQEAMVKFHGSQCGFCTPGFVMSLFAMFKNHSKFKDDEIKDSLEYIWTKDSHYAELKQNEVMRERFEILSGIDEYVGKYVSNEWVRKNILRQTDEEIKELDKQIKKETDTDPDDFEYNPDLTGNTTTPSL